jgi:hypothetical protein
MHPGGKNAFNAVPPASLPGHEEESGRPSGSGHRPKGKQSSQLGWSSKTYPNMCPQPDLIWLVQWIGLRENLQETLVVTIK